MSAFESQAPWPARQMRAMAWLIVEYCIEKSGLGMMLLIHGMCELCGKDSIISLFFPEYL